MDEHESLIYRLFNSPVTFTQINDRITRVKINYYPYYIVYPLNGLFKMSRFSHYEAFYLESYEFNKEKSSKYLLYNNEIKKAKEYDSISDIRGMNVSRFIRYFDKLEKV